MSALNQRIRSVARKFHLDIQWLKNSDPHGPLVRLLSTTRVTQVIDVGANNGGFASIIRLLGYRGDIHSFEPLSSVFEQLNSKSQRDDRWHSYNLALGAENARVTMNVAANNGASSSVLEMLDTHKEAAPEALIVGTEEVDQITLDSFIEKTPEFSAERYFLKMDVQGYEDRVLSGAPETLKAPNLVGLRLELSMIPLYRGSLDWKGTIAMCEELGFELIGINEGFAAPSGRMLQMDGTFVRRDYLETL